MAGTAIASRGIVRNRTWRRALSAAVAGAALAGAVGAVTVAGWEHPLGVLAARVQGGRLLEAGRGVLQREHNDCGPAALAHCLHRLGDPVPYPDPDTVIELGPRGCGFDQLLREAARYGWQAAYRRIDPSGLDSVAPPAVLYLRRGHFVVYEGRDAAGTALVHDPAIGRLAFAPPALRRIWTGDVLEILGATVRAGD